MAKASSRTGSKSTSSSRSRSALAKTGLDGWITTKKKGRDDNLIAADQRRAMEAHRSNRQQRKPTGRKAQPPKKSRKSFPDDSSMDGFIVNSDDEEEEEGKWEGEDSEDDDDLGMSLDNLLSKKPKTENGRKRALDLKDSRGTRRGRNAKSSYRVDNDDDDDDESIEEEETKNGNKTAKLVSLESDNDDDDDDEVVVKNPKPTARRNGGKKAVASNPKSPASSLSLARCMEKENNAPDDDSTSSVEVMTKSRSQKPKAGSSVRKVLSVKKRGDEVSFDSDDDEDLLSPDGTFAGKPLAQPSSKRRRIIEDDDDDDDMHKAIQISLAESQQNNDLNFDSDATPPATVGFLAATTTRDTSSGDFIDDDEALEYALKKSARDFQKNMTKKKRLQKQSQRPKGSSAPKRSTSKKPKQAMITLDGSEEEEEALDLEEDDDDNEMDDQAETEEYVDDAEREAGSVLAAADALSAEVLRTMVGWRASTTSNAASEKDGGSIPKGIIVDGALAMTTLSADLDSSTGSTSTDSTTNSTSSSLVRKEGYRWISQAEMQRICPLLKLADYQLIGVNWIALLHSLKCNVAETASTTKSLRKKDAMQNVSGVLADEMGLGKTVQTIAFLAWLRHIRGGGGVQDGDDKHGDLVQSNKCRPHLVVVPASVLSNWLREFQKFAPDMTVVKYHGSLAERSEIKDRLRQSLNSHEPLDVVVTTVSYFSTEKSADRDFLRKFHFDYLIVDEGHCLKDHTCLRYRNLDMFTTSHRLLITGTPVQNSAQQLMSLLCFLMPLFSRQSSSPDYEEKAKHDGGKRMLENFVALGGNSYDKLKQLLAPFVLRRRKVDVLNQGLPKKTRRVEFVPLDRVSREVYDGILCRHLQAREKNAKGASTAERTKSVFTDLRKAANHPLLLRTRHKDSATLASLLFRHEYFGNDKSCTLDLVKKELANFSDFDVHCAALELMDDVPSLEETLSPFVLLEEDLFSSPKFLRLRTLLPQLVKEGHRILIFSQWTRCLDLLGCLMDHVKMPYLRLDGSTKIEQRQELIDRFNTQADIPVFLLSTRAGGMGINLTAADTCILHDLDFNPFNDIQAEDRCHRIGQTKPVTVIKMVTQDTVDSDIYNIQERKAQMNAAILENGRAETTETTVSRLTEQEEMNEMLRHALDRYLTKGEGGGDSAGAGGGGEGDAISIDDD